MSAASAAMSRSKTALIAASNGPRLRTLAWRAMTSPSAVDPSCPLSRLPPYPFCPQTFPAPQRQDRVLAYVDVLVLAHQHVPEPPVALARGGGGGEARRIGRVTQGRQRVPLQVGEIDRAGGVPGH